MTVFEKEYAHAFSRMSEILSIALIILVFLAIKFIPSGGYAMNALGIVGIGSIFFVLLWHHVIIDQVRGFNINIFESFIDLTLIALVILFTGKTQSPFLVLLLFPVVISIGNFSLLQNSIILLFSEVFLFALLIFFYSQHALLTMVAVMLSIAIADAVIMLARSITKKIDMFATAHSAKVDELTELNRYKDEFVYVTTHKLRSPISIIKGYLDLLSRDKENTLSKKSQDILQSLQEHTDILEEIVEELLNISRLESGKIIVTKTTFDMTALVESVIARLAVNASKKQVNVSLAKECQSQVMVNSDQERIEEILVNLIDNAIKYSKSHGNVTIAYKVNGGKIEISIQDDGIGIPLDEQTKIFQKFFRARNVYNLAVHGTGLGLYIVYRLVDLLKGYIQFSSEENKGTTFRILLPIQ